MTVAAARRNPYIVGRPISEPELFYGRDDLFAFIEDHLRQRSQVILLHGQRRIGKSSVILQIPHFVDPEQTDFVFVPFDLHNKAQLSLGEVLHRLAGDIFNRLKFEVPSVTLPTISDLEANPTLFSETVLPKLYRVLNDRNLVLLLDEFDVLSRTELASSATAASETFFPYLQTLLESYANLFIIPVVGRQLDDMPKFLSLFKNAPNQRVGLLKEPYAKQLIVERTKDALEYTPDAVNAVLELSAGHPYFTQVVCHAVFAQARLKEKWQVRRRDVESAVDDAIEISEGGLAWFWDGLQIPEQVVFSAVAETQTQTTEQATLNGNIAGIDETYHQVSHAKIHLHLSRLQTYKKIPYQLLAIEIVAPDRIIEPQDLTTLELPAGIDSAEGIVIEGRAPNWLYSYLLQALPTMPWMATYDPRYGAIVVSARSQQVQIGQILEIATAAQNAIALASPLTILREQGVVPIESFSAALARLVESEFVTLVENAQASPSKAPIYTVQIELVRRWLTQHHPLRREIWQLEKLNSAAQQLYEIATECHQRGDLDTALKHYQDCIEINPNHFSALFAMAEASLETEVFSQAVELFARAHQVDAARAQDGFVRSLLDYGRDLIFQNNPNLARTQLSKALSLDANNREVKALVKLMQSETPARRVLILAASPRNMPTLRLGEEIQSVENSLARKNDGEHFLVRSVYSVQSKDLAEILREFQPQIVHYSGHGTESEGLWLEDASGRVSPVSGEALASLFELFSDCVECTVLNTSYSESVGREIVQHIHYVICTNSGLGDKARVAFSRGFYKALSAGTSIEKAYHFGCTEIQLQNISDEHLSYMLLKNNTLKNERKSK